MQNSIWFFGDCFTWGWGCTPEHEYYKYRQKGDKIWTNIVSDYYNMNHVKPKYSYGAPSYILVNLINHLKHIKKGDIVIISDSEVKAALTIGRNKHKVKCLNSFNFEDFKDFHSQEEKQAIIQYVNTEIAPYEEIWEDFHKTNILDIAKEIYCRGVKTIFWSHRIWKQESKFETIKQHTDSKIDDPHFSWTGHKEMAKYIIDKIENKQWVTPELI